MRVVKLLFITTLFVFVLPLVFVYGMGFYLDTGVPFYKDGFGVVAEVSFKLGLSDISDALLPIFFKGGMGFQYARGSNERVYVDYIDFGLIAGGEYLLEFRELEKVAFSVGLDFYLSYGSKFNDFSGIGSLGVNFRPVLGLVFLPREKLSVRINVGYNAGIYSFYLGHIKFSVGVDLKL
ncbi:MAG: hypothetical protein N2712_07205 [Brevinematales bacterium]|nr:hypothetical protein [Brevinematales bacterium]